MTDTVQPVSRAAAVLPQLRTAQAAAAPASAAGASSQATSGSDPASSPVPAAAKATAPPPPVHHDAMTLSVDRDEMGVFVYTLTDSSSGRVIAVIPREAAHTGGGDTIDLHA